MLLSRSSRLSTRSVFSNVPRSRQISSFANNSRHRWPSPLISSTPSNLIGRSSLVLPAVVLSAPFAPRFLSSTSSPPAATTSPSATSTDVSAPVADLNPYQSLFEKLPGFDEATSAETITPHIGYLHELGLNFWYGPTSSIQWLLEHIHVYADTPWWGSILISALVVRGVLLYPFILASNEQAKNSAMKPAQEAIKEKYKEIMKNPDPQARQQATFQQATEMRHLIKSFGLSFPKMLTPAVLQAALGFGTFRLLRNMCHLSIPGLDEGGVLWFTDLTIPDPLYILPLASAAILHVMFRLGGETGAATAMSPAQMKLLLYLFPGIMFAVGAFLPAALQFVFLTSGTLGFMQARILRSPTIRRWLKLLPLTISVPMAHPAFKSSSKQVQKSMEEIARKKAPKPKSIIEQAKSTGSSFVEKLNGQAGKPKESQFSREAKNYEKRRREQLRREEDMKKRY